MLAVILGTFLEGVVVGTAQEHVLRRRVASLPRWSWTRATAAGAALAWVLGMVPSTIMALGTAQPAPSTATEPTALVQYGLAMAMGLVAGPILGAAQWSVLRRVVAHAGWWLWANAAAWAVGMPLIFAGMDLVPWTTTPHAADLGLEGPRQVRNAWWRRCAWAKSGPSPREVSRFARNSRGLAATGGSLPSRRYRIDRSGNRVQPAPQ